MNRVPKLSNAGGNDQDKDMNTPPRDIVLLPESLNNTNNHNTYDNNTLTPTNIHNYNNMIQSSRAGLNSSSSLDSYLSISAIPKSVGRMRASELVGLGHQLLALTLSLSLGLVMYCRLALLISLTLSFICLTNVTRLL